jgi:hypothetical protein
MDKNVVIKTTMEGGGEGGAIFKNCGKKNLFSVLAFLRIFFPVFS